MNNAIIWATIGGAAGITVLRALAVTIAQLISMERERKERERRARAKAEKRKRKLYREQFCRNMAEIERDFS